MTTEEAPHVNAAIQAFNRLNIAERSQPLLDPATLGRGSVVQDQPKALQTPGAGSVSLLDAPNAPLSMFMLAGQADGLQPWGIAPTYRDRQLRMFLPTESYTMGAIATCIATNMGLDYQLEGQPRSVAAAHDVMVNAQFGEGWEAWTGKMSTDFYGQDKGAFTEFVRDFDDPAAPVTGFNHLDAARCWHTGNRTTPVLYVDLYGKWHGLKWYQVGTLREMPAPHEVYYGLQYCALTRIMHISQLLRNIFILHQEQASGRHTRKVHVVSGVGSNEIENAMKTAQREADQKNLTRWTMPVIVTTLDPQAAVKLETIALAELPEDWAAHLDDYMKWFMVAIAMGLLRDYQDFAPLPGGGIGTSAQSQILHQKSRGKGPAIWQKRVSHLFNNQGVMPRNVTFKFDEEDIEEEKQRADILNTYAQGLDGLITAAAIDPQGAREILLKAKIIDQDFFDQMAQRAVQLEAKLEQQRQDSLDALASSGVGNNFGRPPAPGNANNAQPAGRGRQAPPARGNAGNGNNRPSVAQEDGQGQRDSELGARGMTLEFDDDRIVVEDRLTERAQRALDVMGRDVRRRLRAEN